MGMSDEWLLAGRYRVDAPIGSGGMGEVWRGYDQQIDRRVAIKLMHRPTPQHRVDSSEAAALSAAAATSRERFLREVRTTALLDHPGIPAVYDFGVEESTERVYLVMQLLYGETLAEIVGGVVARPISWSAAVAAQVAATLVDVHRVDVVHRDIKPSNIIITDRGLVKLLDFGVAVLRGASALPRLTQVGQTVGSPPYMSREQAMGNPVGPPTDVYGLGCVLHEMLTGRTPFLKSPTRSFQDHHINTPPQSMRQLRGDIPEELDRLVLAMLAKQPTKRPEAEAVYEALLPLISSVAPADLANDRDPRQPFVRPLAPAPRRTRVGSGPSGTSGPAIVPVSPGAEWLSDTRVHARDLVRNGQIQQAIDLLENALARSTNDRAAVLDVRVELATTLYTADEFSRAASLLDETISALAERDGENDKTVTYLRYIAGVTRAEIGDVDEAIQYFNGYLKLADVDDPPYRDAKYQRALMLHASGRAAEGLAELIAVRKLLEDQYGPDSVHVRALDRRVEQLQRHPR
jgi:serine/threonine protein kinase